MDKPLASVVIPLYNDAATIQRCLDSLLTQSIIDQLEIVVVNDGSVDNGAELAARYPIMLVHQGNAGPAAARNTGARYATGEVLLFLDADCVANPNWAKQMLAAFDNPAIVAAMGCIDSATEELLPELIQTEIDERYRKLSKNQYIDFFASVAVAIRRDFFLKIGGFREDFRYNEDVELAYRIHSQNGKIVFVASEPVSHHHPTTWREYFLMKFWRGVWRMRLYQLFPKKAVSDNWTPQTLKFQVGISALLPLCLIIGFWYPIFWTIGLALLVLGLVSAHAFLYDANRRGGILLTLWSIPFLYVRAFALGSAIVWHMLTRRTHAVPSE